MTLKKVFVCYLCFMFLDLEKRPMEGRVRKSSESSGGQIVMYIFENGL